MQSEHQSQPPREPAFARSPSALGALRGGPVWEGERYVLRITRNGELILTKLSNPPANGLLRPTSQPLVIQLLQKEKPVNFCNLVIDMRLRCSCRAELVDAVRGREVLAWGRS